MVNRFLIVIIIELVSLSLFAQQEPLYSIFWNTPSSYNPATTGEQNKYYGALNLRNQWVGLEGSPLNVTALIELRIDTINSAFGISYNYSQLGLEKSNKININYSYHFNLPKDRKIGIGIAPSFIARQFENTKFIAIDDPLQDPAIPNSNGSASYFDLNAGISYISKKLRVGFGTTQLLESEASSLNQYKNTRHYFGNISYDFQIGNKFKLTPRSRIAAISSVRVYELNIVATYNERYWIGGSFRSEIAFGVMAGIDIAKKFRIGYAFDYYTSDAIRVNFGGSHEIVLAIMLN